MKRVLVIAVVASGCNYVTDSFTTNDFSGDPYPFPVDTDSGAIVIGVRPDGDTTHVGVLDVLSPLTLVDHGTDAAPTIDYPDVELLGKRTPDGALELPRAKLLGPQLLTLHPCADAECDVGPSASPTAITAIVGMSAFVSDALRLNLSHSEIFILPDIAGTETDLSNACEAVLPLPFRGGGTLLFGGTELTFANWRIAIDACFAPNPTGALQSDRGTDMLLVASTSIGTSLLAASSYQRYHDNQCADPTAPCTVPDLASLPTASEFLPSGLVAGHLASIPSLALVGNSSSNPRAPCRQVYASHVLAVGNCTDPVDPTGLYPSNDPDKCPCYDPTGDTHNTFCQVPAIFEIAPATQIPILVIDDADSTLQALRAELRPNQPEVDGILGTSVLQSLELDIDYPHSRLAGRCADTTTCTTRPELTGSLCQRKQVQGCLQLPILPCES